MAGYSRILPHARAAGRVAAWAMAGALVLFYLVGAILAVRAGATP